MGQKKQSRIITTNMGMGPILEFDNDVDGHRPEKVDININAREAAPTVDAMDAAGFHGKRLHSSGGYHSDHP